MQTGIVERINRAQPMRVICRTEAMMAEAVEYMESCELIASDVETIPHMPKSKKKQPFVMTVSSYTGLRNDGEMRSYALQLTRQKSAIMPAIDNQEAVWHTMRQINANPVRKVLHNGVYDSAWFIRYRVPLVNYAYDTMTMWWSRYPDIPKTLDVVSSVLLDDHRFWKMGRKEEDFTAHTFYAMEDTETTLRCALVLMRWMLDDPDMLRNFNDAHRRCLIGLGMSLRGMPMDWDKRAELEQELIAESASSLAKLRWITANDELNPNSPAQMVQLLYKILGAKPRSAKGREYKVVNKGTKLSTGALAMRAMRADNPLIGRVISAIETAKKPAKQLSNVMSLQTPDGRFRTSYDGIGTTTTRYSSRRDAFGFGGNAQNIRKKFRRIMRADADSFILEIDFSAADDVFVSYESEEQKKIDLVESGVDTHSYNASAVFFTNWTYDQVVAGKKAEDVRVVDPIIGIRQITKKTTHGANYLMAGMTLLVSAGRDAIVAAAKHLGHDSAGSWSTKRLSEFCDFLDQKYRLFYPRFERSGSNSFYTDLQKGLNKHQSYTTIFGYRQRFTSDPADQSTLRACAATVGQANTAGRVNMALDELELGIRVKEFRDGEAPDSVGPALWVDDHSFGCSLRFQTHDSISYNVKHTHPNWQEGVDRIMKVMQRPVVCRGRVVNVGIEADVAIRWAENAERIYDVNGINAWLDSQKNAVKNQLRT